MSSEEENLSAKSFSNAIRESVWIRVAILLAILAALTLAFLPADVTRELTLKAAYFFGLYLAPGIIVGGILGWIKFDRRTWLWATVISTAVIDSVVLLMTVMSKPG